MANFNYYIGPYVWTNDSWNPPAGTVGAIDLRNLTDMGTPTVQNGAGFFATTDTLGAEYDLLGQGDLRDINSTRRMKSTWNGVLGYSPNGNKLVDLLYDHMTVGADPTGADTVRPLMPSRGSLRVTLQGHSLVKSTQFRFGHSPENNNVLSVLKEDYREVRDLVMDAKLPADHHRKLLDFWGHQHSIKDPHLMFIPSGLPVELSLPHDTSITEDFDGANKALVGHDLTWVEFGTVNWDNFSNRARMLEAIVSDDARACYANSALTGADQQVSATTHVQGTDNSTVSGVICRRSNAAITYYVTRYDFFTPDWKIFLNKVVTGTLTVLGSQIIVAESLPDTIKMTVIGSDLEAFFNDVSKSTATDTAITGNLFCGLYGRASATVETEIDDWSAEDIITASPDNAALLMGIV